jgi:hypothetical protein
VTETCNENDKPDEPRYPGGEDEDSDGSSKDRKTPRASDSAVPLIARRESE